MLRMLLRLSDLYKAQLLSMTFLLMTYFCDLICLSNLFQYPWRDQKLEEEVEFAQNVVKSIRSIRGDYNLTTKMKPEGMGLKFIAKD